MKWGTCCCDQGRFEVDKREYPGEGELEGWRWVSIQGGRRGTAGRAEVSASCRGEGACRCWAGIQALRERSFEGGIALLVQRFGGTTLPWACGACSQWKRAAASAGIGTGCAMLLDEALNLSRQVGNEAYGFAGEKNTWGSRLFAGIGILVFRERLCSQESWQDPTSSERVSKCQKQTTWSISPWGKSRSGKLEQCTDFW